MEGVDTTTWASTLSSYVMNKVLTIGDVATTESMNYTEDATWVPQTESPQGNNNNVDPWAKYRCSISYEGYLDQLDLARRYCRLVIGGVLIVCGTLGNCLTLAVLRSKAREWASSAVFILQVLAVVDTAMLVLAIEDWLRVFTNGDFYIRTLNVMACRIRLYSLMILTHMSSWTIVILSVQRAIVVCFPMMASRICTFKKTVRIWVFMVLFWILWNSHVLETYTIYRVPMRKCEAGFWKRIEGVYCLYQGRNSIGIPEEVMNWSSFVTISALPAVIICVANSCIIWAMARPDATLNKENSKSSGASSKSNARRNSMTRMLVTVSTMFLLTTLPSAIFHTRNSEWFGTTGYLTQKEIAHLYFALEIVSLIFYINNASNFLLYVLSGPPFRKAFLDLIFKRQKKRRPTSASQKASSLVRMDSAMF